jgi:hypothetical protein
MGRAARAALAVVVSGVVGGALSGCGGDDEGASVDAGAADAAVADAGAPDAMTSVTVSGLLVELLDQDPVPDVTVSVVDHPELGTATTDATGRWSLGGVPAFSDIVVRFDAEGYFPASTRVLAIEDVDYGVGEDTSLFMTTLATGSVMASVIGVELDPEKTMVALVVYGTTTGQVLPGAVAALTPPDERGAVYLSSSGFPDPALESTSTNGSVVFVNVDPGPTTLEVLGPAGEECFGLGADQPSPIRLQQIAGVLTLAGAVLCFQ